MKFSHSNTLGCPLFPKWIQRKLILYFQFEPLRNSFISPRHYSFLLLSSTAETANNKLHTIC